ncbi:MAG: hypothetical protein KY455_02270 [Euryarchaeota archaeon]|nr:hypothetical protein [Euryarchaeota archaeon]
MPLDHSTSRVALLVTLSLAIATLFVPTSQAGIIGGLIDTVDGTLDSLIETDPAPSAEIQTVPESDITYVYLSDTRTAEQGTTAAPADTTAVRMETEVAWWPFAIGAAAILLAAFVILARGRRREEEQAKAEIEEAEVVWKERPKQEAPQRKRSDPMAALEADLAEPRNPTPVSPERRTQAARPTAA